MEIEKSRVLTRTCFENEFSENFIQFSAEIWQSVLIESQLKTLLPTKSRRKSIIFTFSVWYIPESHMNAPSAKTSRLCRIPHFRLRLNKFYEKMHGQVQRTELLTVNIWISFSVKIYFRLKFCISIINH